MPIYSYQCNNCNHEFELLVGVSSESKKPACTKCESADITKTIGGFGAVVDGSKPKAPCESSGSCCGSGPGGVCGGGMCPM